MAEPKLQPNDRYKHHEHGWIVEVKETAGRLVAFKYITGPREGNHGVAPADDFNSHYERIGL